MRLSASSRMKIRRDLPALMANLEHFLAVARVGNVSRAAHELSIGQPALTARLHALEAQVGQTLFVRTRRGVRLTQAGKAFLPHAERALQAAEDAANAAEEAASGLAGSLVVGATPSVSATVLPAALRRVREAFPATRLSVRTGHSEQIVELVLREEVGVGVVRELRHPDLEPIPLFDDELVLVVAPTHRFAGLDGILVAALRDEQLVLFDRTSSYNELTSTLFGGAGIAPSSLIELDNIEAARRMVQEGIGVALLPMSSVAGEVREGSVVRVRITDAPPVRRRYVAIRRRDSAAADGREDLFINAVREFGSAAAGPGASPPRARSGAARARGRSAPGRGTG